MFSSRVPEDRRTNRIADALARARARGSLLDLPGSNPTRVGSPYPTNLLAPLADAQALTYEPQPFGLTDARGAIAETFLQRGIAMSADRIVLTASTSEAYSILFKLLCDPGESSVLTPVPSYPLFDYLTRLDGIRQVRYPLEYHGGWSLDPADVDRVWTDDTRAVLAVSPNNPTGSVLSTHEADELVRRSVDRQAALIVDEVFCDYPLTTESTVSVAFDDTEGLIFRLGGLSKTAGLPQVKLGWIAVRGGSALVAEALDRLELICDTYLSVSTPVQVAARALLEQSRPVRELILERVRSNDALLRRVVEPASGVSVLPAQAGWSAVLRVPATRSEEALVLDLLDRHRVVVHPGFFFDFPREAFLVVSLLPEPRIFASGVHRILESVCGG